MMHDTDLFNVAFFFVMLVIITLQFGLNLWAYMIQRGIEKDIKKDETIPEALKDRAEVTLWQTISSFLFVLLGYRTLLDFKVDPHITLVIFGAALAVKTIPSARWLWRYYHGSFS